MQWTIDTAHSEIHFAVRHMGISTARGSFSTFTGSVDESSGNVSSVDVQIDMASINTGDAGRDAHLKGPDFFDVATYPKASFALTSFERRGEDVTATGNLTMRGVTHPVTLTGDIAGPAKDPWGNEKVSATLATTISRKQWGLVWNVVLESGGFLVSDDVRMTIDVQAAPAVATVGAAA